MGLGFAYDNSGQYDQAIHAYHEDVRLKPAWPAPGTISPWQLAMPTHGAVLVSLTANHASTLKQREIKEAIRLNAKDAP